MFSCDVILRVPAQGGWNGKPNRQYFAELGVLYLKVFNILAKNPGHWTNLLLVWLLEACGEKAAVDSPQRRNPESPPQVAEE